MNDDKIFRGNRRFGLAWKNKVQSGGGSSHHNNLNNGRGRAPERNRAVLQIEAGNIEKKRFKVGKRRKSCCYLSYCPKSL